MATAQLFTARKSAVVIETENGETIIIRDGLTKAQAKTMAARLNNEATDQDLKPTKREAKYAVHFEGDFECSTDDEYDDIPSIADLKADVKETLESCNWIDIQWVSKEKFTVTVKKLYDKQVPNE